MTKNTVKQKTGVAAYTLYTDAAVKRLGIEDMTGVMTSHVESFDDFDDVQLWVQDMHPVWDKRRDETRVGFEPLVTATVDIALPPEIVWGYLRQPEFRSIIQGTDRTSLENRKAGRMGVESQFQCFHGNHMLRQVILEWTPFERIVSQAADTTPFLNRLTWKNEYRLVPTQSGTELTISLGDLQGSRLLASAVTAFFTRGSRRVAGNMREFAVTVEKDWAERDERAGDAPTVELTVESIRAAAGRNLNDP